MSAHATITRLLAGRMLPNASQCLPTKREHATALTILCAGLLQGQAKRTACENLEQAIAQVRAMTQANKQLLAAGNRVLGK